MLLEFREKKRDGVMHLQCDMNRICSKLVILDTSVVHEELIKGVI